MRVALLGPLAVTENDSTLDLSGPKRRALLILLALNAGTPVSRDRIVEAMWPRERTGREESTLRVHVSHLRDVLEPDRNGDPQVLVTQGSAYMLTDEHLALDTFDFVALTEEGRTLLSAEPEAALDRFNAALALWRGRPLQDVEYEEFAQDDIRRLEMARVDAIEDRAEALIACGEDVAAIEDLEPLVRSHPTRERPVRLLMRALYRSGRQSEALRVAGRHTRDLVDQGLEPSPGLRRLEEQILQHDPALLPEGVVSPGDIKPGRSVRGYELREESGAGSVGVVYRAFQASVGREVALKVVNPQLAETPEFVRRFAEEARVVAGLEHPYIVPLHDFWREPGGAFLVMRWMDGGSLEDRLGHGWEPDEIGRVFGQLSDALGYAHSAGVVHRDVKPANVLFDGAGNAYLCDFGLAVTGIDTGADRDGRLATIQPPYASPEQIRGEGPTVASDVFGLGVLLAEAVSGAEFMGPNTAVDGPLREVVLVATAANPADRYPDMAAFRAALLDAVGTTAVPAPRRLRRNPYKGLAPFDEGDRADFYGRDDTIENLLDVVGGNGLSAIIGASGSGKSSVVLAGLVPQLRDGALAGSDEWSIVTMVPGTDPFDEFHIGLRAAAVGYTIAEAGDRSRELRHAFAAALEGPTSRALLIVDQFEELFSSEIDEDTRQQFLDNLADLAVDPAHRIRVVLTLRADFSDRPLAHPRFGDLMSRASVLVAPMRPEQVEDAIRGPAARVGVQVEPGLIAEIVRDVASAPAYLPLLQYVLSELFERRAEDRLTVAAYRSLGGVHGVLERRAEATFSALGPDAQAASRQLFLRMVHLGDHGEETRRRLPLTELHGLGGRAEVDEALEAFAAARLLTYDRDPVTRTPTVEVAHETVIQRWTRYRIWIDEARADLLAHRRLSAAAATWENSGEDPAYLLMGGPLAAASEVASGDRLHLNALETRFVAESEAADQATRAQEVERGAQEAALQSRSRRRLAVGIAAAVVAVVVGIAAGFAWVQRQRADDLAAAQERQNTSRELAAASVNNLASSDPDLSLLLAIEAADQSLDAGEEILPEAVDALHLAVINPRPDQIIEGAGSARGGRVLEYSADGSMIVTLTDDAGAWVLDPHTGTELGRIAPVEEPAFGVGFHPDGQRIITVHRDAVRQWGWASGELLFEYDHPVPVRAGVYSADGSKLAIGGDDGTVAVWDTNSQEVVSTLDGEHEGPIMSLGFNPAGDRMVTAGADLRILTWDVESAEVTAQANTPTIVLPASQVAWHPWADAVAAATLQSETFLFSPTTGERLNSYGNGQNRSVSVAFDSTGNFLYASGADGLARAYGALTGGEEGFVLPTGGAPLRDMEGDVGRGVATVGVDGKIRIWDGIIRTELPARTTIHLYPNMSAAGDGTRYVFGGAANWIGVPAEIPATYEVVDAATGELLLQRPTVQDWVNQAEAAISADGSLMAAQGPDGNVEIVTIDTGAVVTVPDTAGWAPVLAFSADGRLLAGTGADGTISLWDTTTGEVQALLIGHGDREAANASTADSVFRFDSQSTARVGQLRFRPVEEELVSAGWDGTVRVWNTATGEGRVLHAMDYEVVSVAYSPDGGRIAAVDRTGTVVILDAATGDLTLTPDALSSDPGTLVFSPDGKFLATAGPGPTAVMWDLETGRIARRFEGAVYQPKSVAFVEDGTVLRVASGEGIDRGYLLDPLDLVELARTKAGRELTEAECQQYLRRSCGG